MKIFSEILKHHLSFAEELSWKHNDWSPTDSIYFQRVKTLGHQSPLEMAFMSLKVLMTLFLKLCVVNCSLQCVHSF